MKRSYRYGLASIAFCVASLTGMPTAFADSGSRMTNMLNSTGEGTSNPSYGRLIKNIMIFQAGGWSGLATSPACLQQVTPTCGSNPSWPQAGAGNPGGRVGYLSKSNDVFLNQMAQIKAMNQDTAIAVLIMPDEEAAASGYGACYGSFWTNDQSCSAGGTWSTPRAMFANVAWAAWMKGIQVAPLISINVYDHIKGSAAFPTNDDPNRASVAVARLKQYVDWYMSTVNATSLHASDGRVVILTEGLPSNTNLPADNAQASAIIAYMKSRTDILWIDNFSGMSAGQANSASNIYRSASTEDTTGSVQDGLKASWKSHYLWHFIDRWGSNAAYTTGIPEPLRLKWLNISPAASNNYPVIISQWNEYAESLTFEPDQNGGTAEYAYLQWRLGQQP
ncbi:MAG: hypothetical protein GAK28_02185 [Luteibacter sp.]|nr:MAG: hypothetical protein GAK28_02185 [Luteibacter sp.]